jgi:hypothetical protein
MFRVVLPPIIRSACNCTYSIWYLSQRYIYLPLSWKSWNRFECAVGGVPTQASPPTPCAHHYPPPIRATCPGHLIRLDFTTCTILGKEYRSFSSLLCSFLHSPVTLSRLGPNTFLYTLFSNTLSLCSSLNVNDQVSNPYKTTGKIVVIYILIWT